MFFLPAISGWLLTPSKSPICSSVCGCNFQSLVSFSIFPPSLTLFFLYRTNNPLWLHYFDHSFCGFLQTLTAPKIPCFWSVLANIWKAFTTNMFTSHFPMSAHWCLLFSSVCPDEISSNSSPLIPLSSLLYNPSSNLHSSAVQPMSSVTMG